jgi:hypothetical protein
MKISGQGWAAIAGALVTAAAGVGVVLGRVLPVRVPQVAEWAHVVSVCPDDSGIGR